MRRVSLVRDEGVAGSNPATPTIFPANRPALPDSFPDRNKPRDWLFLACQAGHDWQSIGGRNACCDEGDFCSCSVPVNACTRCGDCDYGDNDDADDVRRLCAEKRGDDPARSPAPPFAGCPG
jgi:hypothetical protein